VAIGAHGRHQFAASGRQRDAAVDHLGDDADGQALEQADAFPQRRLEGDLAIHGARGDGRHPVLQSHFGRQFVDALLTDHGGIHVGDEDLLAPRFGDLNRRIHRQLADHGPQPGQRVGDAGSIPERDIAGHAIGEPVKTGPVNGVESRFAEFWRQNRI